MSDRSSYQPPAAPPGEPVYRVFRLGPDHGIHSAQVISAKDDEEAIAIAASMVNGHGIDLWERARCLGSFPPLAAKP